MFDGILFDLDGTLWNATSTIADVWTLTLSLHPEVSRAPVTVSEVEQYMGLPLPDIARRLLPDQPDEVRLSLNDEFCAEETHQLAQHGGILYPGAEPVLAELSRTAKLLIVSNCQSGYIEAFFKAHGLGRYFTDFECAGRTGLPKSANISLVSERNHLKSPVYIGDTLLDYTSARDAGVPFLHAAYGFGVVRDVPTVQSFGEIPEALSRMSPP